MEEEKALPLVALTLALCHSHHHRNHHIFSSKLYGGSKEGVGLLSYIAVSLMHCSSSVDLEVKDKCIFLFLNLVTKKRTCCNLFLCFELTVATPKQIREHMQEEGLTNDEVKSHLQVTY